MLELDAQRDRARDAIRRAELQRAAAGLGAPCVTSYEWKYPLARKTSGSDELMQVTTYDEDSAALDGRRVEAVRLFPSSSRDVEESTTAADHRAGASPDRANDR